MLMLEKPQTRLGALLQSIRERKRFTQNGLGRAAHHSGGYIGLIEDGYNPKTGKPLEPSANVLRDIANALGDGDQEEADRIYLDFLEAAAYLPESQRLSLADQLQERRTEKMDLNVITRGISESDELPDYVKRVINELIEETRRRNAEEPEG